MLKPLSSKEKKLLLSSLKDQFNFSSKLPYQFFINQDKKIFIFNKNLEIDFSKIRINSLGLYFANIKSELRLTIEGSQIIGPNSSKNILTLTESQLSDWTYGKDLTISKEFNGFVLIEYNKDFYGTGKYKDSKILNYLPKERRLKN
tara:strand:- start:214 stop:651 length:438 start_codon:yes stop_codon:yes gene_type:complete